MEKKREKGIFFLQKPKKITFLLHKEFDIKKHGDNKEEKKKFNKGRENRWKEDEQKGGNKELHKTFLKRKHVAKEIKKKSNKKRHEKQMKEKLKRDR